MELVRIEHTEDEKFRQLLQLYQEAFPEEERREIQQLERLIREEPRMVFNAILCDGQPAGLFIYWDLEEFFYLEHLAVFAELRNRKIGQQVLDYVARHLEGERFLEVEPAADEMTSRRVNYYRRNGYEVVTEDYEQPAYDRTKKGMPLWVMSNTGTVSPDLERKIKRIQQTVYWNHY